MASRTIIDLKARNLEESQLSASPQSIDPAIVIDKKAINTEKALIKDLSEQSTKSGAKTPTVPSSTKLTTVQTFGSYMNPTTSYPNDVVILDVQNAIQQYLETNYRIDTYIQKSTKVTLFPEEDLARLGYLSGRYRVTYKFHRNLLGSGDLHKVQVQEISADGLEIRVIPALSSTIDNTAFVNFFGGNFFSLPKTQTLVNLFLFKDANTNAKVFDYVQDKFTFDTNPYSIIFKLTSPVTDSIRIGDLLWLAQQVSEDVVDEITIIPPKYQPKTVPIAGPNFDVASRDRTQTATTYKDWDDLLTTNTLTANDIINKLLSGSLIEGIPLNIDYRNFENFIHFGSAQERLLNFKYKMELLEDYDSRIAALTTDLLGLSNSSVTSSQYYQTNVIDARTKKAALIGSFDGYEKYLYYESSSYESNSYGEFYPTTWPKQNNSSPYTNYSTTSSIVEDWFDGIISSASLYDTNNAKALYKLIPEHVLEDPSNEEYILFTHMIGHYYDLMFSYIKQMTLNTDRNESVFEGFSKDLIYHVARNLGVDFENGNTLEELWSYTLGTDATGSLISTSGVSAENKTKEVWKRIINNLPYLLKTRGTERGVRALINCFGIPSTILRIREYGGAEPYFESKNDMVYERFNYSTIIGNNDKNVTTGPTVTSWYNQLRIPWRKLNNGYFPMTTEFRVKMAPNQTKDQYIAEVSGAFFIKAFKSASGDHVGLFMNGNAGWLTSSVSCSIYDGTWHHIALTRDDLDDEPTTAIQTYKLAVRKTNYEKVVATYTASLSFAAGNATSQSYNSRFVTASNLWIPRSGSSFQQGASQANRRNNTFELFSGSIQEFRYWNTTLQDSILDNHALAPTSFQGNLADTYTGSTSSFYDLAFRISLGADNNKVNFLATTRSISQHPDQSRESFLGITLANSTASYSNGFSSSLWPGYGTGAQFTSSYYPNVEIHSLEWPDLGGNRSVSNKIRIDDGVLLTDEDQLFRNNSIQRSLSDNQPIDSPRLGIYLSPTNEVNQDIAEQFGGISIDDYIGDPSQLASNNYPDLEKLYREYSKKYTRRNNTQTYIRLIKHFDSALFQMIKKFVPYRANTQVGLVVEPHLLSRSKVPVAQPSHEPLHYSGSLDATIYRPGGFIQDGDGEPFRDGPYYVEAGTIGGDQSDYLRLSGDQQNVAEFGDKIIENGVAFMAPRHGIDVTPLVPEKTKYDMVVVDGNQITRPIEASGAANEYNRGGISEDPSDNGRNSLYQEINLGLTSYGVDKNVEGSKYMFTSYTYIPDLLNRQPAKNLITDTTTPVQSNPQVNTTNWLEYNDRTDLQSILTTVTSSEAGILPTPDRLQSATLTTITRTSTANSDGFAGYVYNPSGIFADYRSNPAFITVRSGSLYAFDFWINIEESTNDDQLYIVDEYDPRFSTTIEGVVLGIGANNYGVQQAGFGNALSTIKLVSVTFTGANNTPPTKGEWCYFRMIVRATVNTTEALFLSFLPIKAIAHTIKAAFQNPRFYEYSSNIGKHILYTSSRYDYHEVFPPVIQDSRYSEIANVNTRVYNDNMYGNYKLTDPKLAGSDTVVSLRTALNTTDPNTREYTTNLKKIPLFTDYGLKFASNMFTGSLECPTPFGPSMTGPGIYWQMGTFTGVGLRVVTGTAIGITGSVSLPGFFYEETDNTTKMYRYRVTVETSAFGATGTSRIRFSCGGLNSKFQTIVTMPHITTGNYQTAASTITTFETLADGPYLTATFLLAHPGSGQSMLSLRSISITCLNYRSQTQDYHLQDSYGMRNARYDGCKMSSTDWNVDSPDTSDGGPVVTITVGGGNQLSNVRPGIRGNYEII